MDETEPVSRQKRSGERHSRLETTKGSRASVRRADIHRTRGDQHHEPIWRVTTPRIRKWEPRRVALREYAVSKIDRDSRSDGAYCRNAPGAAVSHRRRRRRRL